MQKAQTATKLNELKIPKNFKILDDEDFVSFLDSLKENNQNIVSQMNSTLEFVVNYLESNNILYSGTIDKEIDRGGVLLFKNTTTTIADTVFHNMRIDLYPSITGDSGSAIIHHLDNRSKIVGVHMDGACLFNDISENQTQINLGVGSTFYMDGQYHYKSFSALGECKKTS